METSWKTLQVLCQELDHHEASMPARPPIGALAKKASWAQPSSLLVTLPDNVPVSVPPAPCRPTVSGITWNNLSQQHMEQKNQVVKPYLNSCILRHNKMVFVLSY